ncbi:MAG: hypothetical protein IPM17_04480 [Verrucomicrobia bacterium]|nr:hypothetical protein [Verrucomicrobiota bacterium]
MEASAEPIGPEFGPPLRAGALSARDQWLRRLHQSLLGVLWAATLGVFLAWACGWSLPIRAEPEPLAALLGMISTAVTWLYGLAARRFEQGRRALAETRAELREERYSLAHALAYGYVHNFLAPAVTHLLAQAGRRAAEVRFYVYLPADLGELEPDAIQRTLARIRCLGYETGALQLDLRQSRPRDVLTLMRQPGGAPAYFDFPTTLLTLRHLVDYRLETRQDSFPDRARRELGQTYIAEFRSELERHLAEKDLRSVVVLVDRELRPLGSGTTALATPESGAVAVAQPPAEARRGAPATAGPFSD